MRSVLHAHASSHPDAEVWLDGHPLLLQRWAGSDPVRMAVLPSHGQGLVTGVTTNPNLLDAALANGVLTAETVSLLVSNAGGNAERLAWEMMHEAIRRAAAALEPLHARSAGRRGWVSAQVDPQHADDSAAMVRHAEQLAALAPNIMVKLPATVAGMDALETLAAHGIATNTTLSTTASQARMALEALARGSSRRGSATPAPPAVLTFMVGRLGEAIGTAHAADLSADDVRTVERMALAAQHRLVAQSGVDVRLLVCSLRANALDDACGVPCVHVAAGRALPWVLTCPLSFMERMLARDDGAELADVDSRAAQRLMRVPAVHAAVHANGLTPHTLPQWPALLQNRAEHRAAVQRVILRARALVEES